MASANPPAASAIGATPGEIPALDGFRAIAIGLVMLSHVGMEKIVPGQFGVTLFFFLSGYLITTLLRREYLRTGAISLKAFYFRRAVRILPPLTFALAMAAVMSLSGLIHPLYLPGLVSDGLFLSNYLPLSGVPIGLWSLAVEEHFYFLFPGLALVLFARGGAGRCAAVCALLCAIVLIVRVMEVARGAEFAHIAVWTHTRIDSIMFGAILACWNNPVIDARDRLPPRWTSYAIALALLAVSFAIRDEVFRHTIRYTIQGGALIFLFNAAIRDAQFARRILDHAFMRFVALLSYTLYLVHSPIVEAARPYATGSAAVWVLAGAIALSFLVAWLVYLAIEAPLHRWRRGVEQRWRRSESVPDEHATVPADDYAAVDRWKPAR